MATADLEVLKAIGALQEAVKNLLSQAEKLDDRAQEHREVIYRRLDDLKEEVSALAARVLVNENTLERIEPSVVRVSAAYERSQGAKHLGWLIWTVVMAIVSAAVTALTHILDMFPHAGH